MANRKAELEGEKLVTMSIRWPKSLMEQIDRQRDAYTSRNLAILKLITEHLNENNNNNSSIDNDKKVGEGESAGVQPSASAQTTNPNGHPHRLATVSAARPSPSSRTKQGEQYFND